MVGISSPAAGTLPAGRRRADADAVTHLESGHTPPEGRDGARPLVAADGRVVGIARLVGMEVGSADAAVGDLDHRLAGLGYGLGKLLETRSVRDPSPAQHA